MCSCSINICSMLLRFSSHFFVLERIFIVAVVELKFLLSVEWFRSRLTVLCYYCAIPSTWMWKCGMRQDCTAQVIRELFCLVFKKNLKRHVSKMKNLGTEKIFLKRNDLWNQPLREWIACGLPTSSWSLNSWWKLKVNMKVKCFWRKACLIKCGRLKNVSVYDE